MGKGAVQKHPVNFMLAYLKGYRKALFNKTKLIPGGVIHSGPIMDVRGRDIMYATAIMAGPKLFKLLVDELKK